MTNIHSSPSPLRQKFIEYLTLNRKAERTVHTYVSFIYSLAKHVRRSPDLLGPEDIRGWLYHLIAERKQAPSTVNLAINAVRSFYGGLPHESSLNPWRGKGCSKSLQECRHSCRLRARHRAGPTRLSALPGTRRSHPRYSRSDPTPCPVAHKTHKRTPP